LRGGSSNYSVVKSYSFIKKVSGYKYGQYLNNNKAAESGSKPATLSKKCYTAKWDTAPNSEAGTQLTKWHEKRNQ